MCVNVDDVERSKDRSTVDDGTVSEHVDDECFLACYLALTRHALANQVHFQGCRTFPSVSFEKLRPDTCFRFDQSRTEISV